MKLSYRVLYVFLSFTLFLMSCQKTPEKGIEPLKNIIIAYTPTSISIPYYIASRKGFFKEEGLEVAAQSHEYGKKALQSVLDGKSDMAVATDTPIMFAAIEGKKLRITAGISSSKKGNAIVAMRDRGIAHPMDLKGKRVGVPPGTSADFFLDSILSIYGLGRNDIGWIPMNPGEMIDFLSKGKVDAVSIWLSTVINLQKHFGDSVLIFFDKAVYSDISCMIASEEFVRKHPEVVIKVLKALIRTEMFIQSNPEEARSLAVELLGIEKADINNIWASFDFKVVLDQMLIKSLEDQTRWAQKNRFTDNMKMPNYLDFIYFDGLQSIRPESVRIIR